MNIKKLAFPLVILVGALSLAACNDDSADQPQGSTQSSSQMQSSDNSATHSDAATADGSAASDNTQSSGMSTTAPKTNNNGDTAVNSSN
ncbi:hypothetical protein [Celerinatantimonas diazotrophica]|uniref:Lipoprotein n=1 Tax=Celerinatantimonas diazotrophica TaxID=412034 RepID=A0A4R1KH71_9GAMM|nr:hypothetical protein [Celerinatantimonas diazotrophica]TCK62729.1 hypothetical protein EV690_0395 [Celerinatantimonas diazotrophica]CAG9298359.1 hypothetical protein CEDIAZO_03559 [Celerinatantimonas diazotrophica]